MAKVNLNVNPYYDDFDEDKNFHKILFKPGVALQARELTQIQSILQDQIRKFGNHIFVDGTRITKTEGPQVSIDTKVRALKLKDTYLGNNISVSDFLDKHAVGANSNIFGRVIAVYDSDEPTIGDEPTVIINLKPGYTNDGIFQSEETITFHDTYGSSITRASTTLGAVTIANVIYSIQGTSSNNSNQITLTSANSLIKAGDRVAYTSFVSDLYVVNVESNTIVTLNKRPGATVTNQNINFIRENTTKTLAVNLVSGIFYKNGYFVKTGTQTTVPEKYSAYPTKSVGLTYNESIVTYNDDTSLLDPAIGSSNYFAPGADRLKITLDLTTKELNSSGIPDVDEDYIEIARLNDGIINYLETQTDYNELGKILAKRTYDESGNYVVTPFKLLPEPSLYSSNTFNLYATIGKAYVGGYEVATVGPTKLTFDKARTTKTLFNLDSQNDGGSYIYVSDFKGRLFPETESSQAYWFEFHRVKNPTDSTTRVGAGVPSHLQYDPVQGEYKLYTFYTTGLYDAANLIYANSIVSVANTLTNPAGSSNNTGSYSTPFYYANIDSLSKNSTTQEFITFNDNENEGAFKDRYIFELPSPYIKNVSNVRLDYSRVYSNVVLSNVAPISITLATGEQFKGGAGTTLGTSTKRENYILVLRSISANSKPYVAGQLLDTGANTTIAISGDGKTITLNIDDTNFVGRADLLTSIETEDLPIRTKTLIENANSTVNLSASYAFVYLNHSDIAEWKGVFKLGSNTFIGTYDSGTGYVANNFVQDNGYMYRAVTTTTGDILSNTNAWSQVNSEFLLDYDLFNGQFDKFILHGWARFTGNTANAPGNVVVIYDYFQHTGNGVVTAESYPDYNKISTFTSPVDRKVLNLRDCLDFRPVQINESNVFTFQDFIKPNPSFSGARSYNEVDIEYYVGRTDRVYVQNRDVTEERRGRIFWIDQGLPEVNPATPTDNTNDTQIAIATVRIPPYTYNTSDVSITYNTYDRYTMKDISNLDKRLTTLEKTVKRQGLEISGTSKLVYDPSSAVKEALFKTSVFTDDFSDDSKSDTASKYFTAKIYTDERSLGPRSYTQLIKLNYLTTTDVARNDGVITTKYTEESAVSQLSPSYTITGHSTVNNQTIGVKPNPNESYVDVSIVKVTPRYIPQFDNESGGPI